jgi:30S ribosomal protein S31
VPTFNTTFNERIRSKTMGKGDSKTAKGKRSRASYGNARSHVATKATGAPAAPVVKKTATKTAAKPVAPAPAKKAGAKKPAG